MRSLTVITPPPLATTPNLKDTTPSHKTITRARLRATGNTTLTPHPSKRTPRPIPQTKPRPIPLPLPPPPIPPRPTPPKTPANDEINSLKHLPPPPPPLLLLLTPIHPAAMVIPPPTPHLRRLRDMTSGSGVMTTRTTRSLSAEKTRTAITLRALREVPHPTTAITPILPPVERRVVVQGGKGRWWPTTAPTPPATPPKPARSGRAQAPTLLLPSLGGKHYLNYYATLKSLEPTLSGTTAPGV